MFNYFVLTFLLNNIVNIIVSVIQLFWTCWSGYWFYILNADKCLFLNIILYNRASTVNESTQAH